MSSQENKQTAQAAYAAFSSGDAQAAMRDIDDSIVWTVGGENTLTGEHKGKQALGELWGQFLGKGLRTTPHDFIAEGDKVIVLTTVVLDGQSTESADVLTYNPAGKLVAFETIGDPAMTNQVFAR
ncbi:MAG: nuclear transport factor 2 family protein [Solirubrobacteraceae bacterium]